VLRVKNRAEKLHGNVGRLEHQAEEIHHSIDEAHHTADALHEHAVDARGTDLPALVTDDEPRKATPFPIVGIGASAGGYEAFADFLTNCPKTPGWPSCWSASGAEPQKQAGRAAGAQRTCPSRRRGTTCRCSRTVST